MDLIRESRSSRESRIRTIRNINYVLERYQGKSLSTPDFDLLYDLDHDQLVDVYHNIKEQSLGLESLSKH